MLIVMTCLFAILCYMPLSAQQIRFDEEASLEQVYQEPIESDELLPMNDVGVEFGYVLYQTVLENQTGALLLQVENIRDYAAVYVDGILLGELTDKVKTLHFTADGGHHQLQLYVENIGRITYGPEILDNSKGLFGEITLSGTLLDNWEIIPLSVRELEVENLHFGIRTDATQPCFYKGRLHLDSPEDCYLDVSGWGMGEVWINNRYVGSFWESEKQQSIPLRAGDLRKGDNEVVVFEMKNNRQNVMRLSTKAIFR